MSDLATQVRNLDRSLNDFKGWAAKLTPSSSSRRGKRASRARLPSWVQDIVSAIDLLSAQLSQLQEAVHRSSGTGCIDEPAGSSGAEDAAQTSLSQNTSTPLRATPAPAPDRHSPFSEVLGASRADTEPELDSIDYLQPRPLSRTPSRNRGRSQQLQDCPHVTSTEKRQEKALPGPVSESQHKPAAGAFEFTLSVDQMEENLVKNAMHFTTHRAFKDCISIKNIPDLDWLEIAKSLQPPRKDHDLLGVTYSVTQPVGKVVELSLSVSRRLEFPNFSLAIGKPSLNESLEYLEKLIKNPPEGDIPYYVGPPLYDGPLMSTINSLLHPGEELLRLGPINGVNSVYWHAGKKGSGTAFHCEDIECSSFNLVLYGWKLWIKIPVTHTARFEAFIRKIRATNDCDQFVRHTSLIVSPRTLLEEGIKFNAILAGPGDLVMTHPREYHMVVNVTENFALAINFQTPGKPSVPKDSYICPKCGLYSLAYEGIHKVPYAPKTVIQPQNNHRRARANSYWQSARCATTMPMSQTATLGKRPGADRLQLETTVKRRRCHRTTPNLEELHAVKNRMQKFDKLCKFPSLKGVVPSPVVFSAVAAIWSRSAIDQFCSLVKSVREVSKHSPQIDLYGDASIRIEQRLRRIESSARRSRLETLLHRIDLIHLVADWESSKQAAGRRRAATEAVNEIMEQSGWEKKKLKRYHRLGNIWKGLCRGDEGLLCFIPLQGHKDLGVTLDTYTEMNVVDMAMFHQLLDSEHGKYTKSLCSVGGAFLKALHSTEVDVDFAWEGNNIEPSKLSEALLFASLQPFPSIEENDYVKESFPEWPVPPEWPEQHRCKWPVDPTALLDSGCRPCELCFEDVCQCIRSHRRPMPRIKDYGTEGRGLQAVADGPGQIAYKTNDIIGEITGEVVPLGTYNDGRTLELVRGDFPGEPPVCQIHCGNKGSVFRLLNHHCQPNTRFCGMTVSGRYRMMVKATRDIRDGEQMTVYYGPDFWGKEKCPCDAHKPPALCE